MVRLRPPGWSSVTRWLVALMLAAGTGFPALSDEAEALVERIASAYEESQCARVVTLCEQLERRWPESVDGVTLYRWGFCESRAGRGSPDRYERAASLLGKRVAAGRAGLDHHFYRVNALINLRRSEQAVDAAEQAVESWESGSLTVDEDDPAAWFRLGKLHRDSGNLEGAMEPFARALELAEQGAALRDAYVERIARGAREAGQPDLAGRAAELLASRDPQAPGAALRLARTRLAAGDLDGARRAFRQARGASGPAGMTAQYGLRAIRRAKQVERWGRDPITELSDGRPLSGLALKELQRELSETAAEAFRVIRRPTVERARKRGPGTRPGASPETIRLVKEVQSRFAGLLVEALRRGAPLRAWSVQGGFGPLIYHDWFKLHRRQDWDRRQDALLQEILEQRRGAGGRAR